MTRKHGRWNLVQLKKAHPSLNDVFLVSHDLDF